MGASVAVMLASAWPERVEKIVLTGANLHAASVRERLKRTVEAALLTKLGPIAPFVSIVTDMIFAASTPESLRSPWREHLRKLPGAAIGAAMRAWRDRPELESVATALRLPVLFIAGAEDTSCTPALAEAIARRMPSASVVSLERAGHMAPYEQPERFAELVHTFLRPPLNGVLT
jgi:pimeloyl-ACP methyl ester carboxylesterase